jgi:hypothetical protein
MSNQEMPNLFVALFNTLRPEELHGGIAREIDSGDSKPIRSRTDKEGARPELGGGPASSKSPEVSDGWCAKLPNLRGDFRHHRRVGCLHLQMNDSVQSNFG